MDKHMFDASLKEALFFMIVSDTDEIKALYKTDPKKARKLFDKRFSHIRRKLFRDMRRAKKIEPSRTYSFRMKGL